MAFVYLTPEQIREIHDTAISAFGGVNGEHVPGMIDYMAEKPAWESFGQEMYPTVFEKAACYWHGFATAQYFADGNKRTAYIVAKVFLLLNGFYLTLEEDELYEYALGVARKDISYDELVLIIQGNSTTIVQVPKNRTIKRRR